MEDFVESQVSADRPGSASVQRSAMLEVWILAKKPYFVLIFTIICLMVVLLYLMVDDQFCKALYLYLKPFCNLNKCKRTSKNAQQCLVNSNRKEERN